MYICTTLRVQSHEKQRIEIQTGRQLRHRRHRRREAPEGGLDTLDQRIPRELPSLARHRVRRAERTQIARHHRLDARRGLLHRLGANPLGTEYFPALQRIQRIQGRPLQLVHGARRQRRKRRPLFPQLQPQGLRRAGDRRQRQIHHLYHHAGQVHRHRAAARKPLGAGVPARPLPPRTAGQVFVRCAKLRKGHLRGRASMATPVCVSALLP